MSKGFLFSIDALLAVSAIIAVSIAFFFLAPKTDSELLQVQMLRIAQDDNAMVSFYLGGLSSTGNVQAFLDDKSTAFCASSYYYNISSKSVVQRNYCGGK